MQQASRIVHQPLKPCHSLQHPATPRKNRQLCSRLFCQDKTLPQGHQLGISLQQPAKHIPREACIHAVANDVSGQTLTSCAVCALDLHFVPLKADSKVPTLDWMADILHVIVLLQWMPVRQGCFPCMLKSSCKSFVALLCL